MDSVDDYEDVQSRPELSNDDSLSELPTSSRRSSFVERKRMMSTENKDDTELVEDFADIDSKNDNFGELCEPSQDDNRVADADDDGVEEELDVPNQTVNDVVEEQPAQPDDSADIPEEIVDFDPQYPRNDEDAPPAAEIEEVIDVPVSATDKAGHIVDEDILEELPVKDPTELRHEENNHTNSSECDHEDTGVRPAVDEEEVYDYRTSPLPQVEDVVDIDRVSSSREKVRKETKPPAGKDTAKQEQVDIAEAAALAAEKSKLEKKASIKEKAAKRHEDFVKRQKKLNRKAGADTDEEGTQVKVGAREEQRLHDAAADEDDGVLQSNLFLPRIANKGIDTKLRKKGDDESAAAEASAASDHEVPARKGLRGRPPVTVKRGSAGGPKEEEAGEDGDRGVHAEGRGVGMDSNSGISGSSNPAPKPPRRKFGGAANRPGRRIASSTTEDGEERLHDEHSRAAHLLPPLVHPRSSPDPSQFGSVDGTSPGEGGNEQGRSMMKIRRHKKPLFLRMIERAQQQTIEDERLKHEQYTQQKRQKQKNNPTAEELREHRAKHDEMMRAKQEEGKRSLAEAAVVNAKAAKRQAAAAAAAAAVVVSEGDHKEDNVSVGHSPTRRKKQTKSGGAAGGSIPAAAAAEEVGLPELLEGPTGGPGSHSHDNGFSPTKNLRSISNSPESPPRGLPLRSPRPHRDSPSAPGTSEKNEEEHAKKIFEVASSPRSKDPTKGPVGGEVHYDHTITIDFEAAAAAVALVPDLPSSSVVTFCGADWLAAFARRDLDEVNNDRETGNVPLRSPSAILRPASPTIDAKSTFHAVSAGGAGSQ